MKVFVLKIYMYNSLDHRLERIENTLFPSLEEAERGYKRFEYNSYLGTNPKNPIPFEDFNNLDGIGGEYGMVIEEKEIKYLGNFFEKHPGAYFYLEGD